jgi:glycine/D-amino acid oxidase-like deaminating enzyme
MGHDTSVLVIGGGATGTGIARDLALRGIDVTLAERTGLSSGTSGRSHGLLHSGARYAEADRVGAEECIAENEVIRSIAGECVDDRGGLFVQVPGDDADYFDERRVACDDIGIDTHRLSGAEARRRVPGLSPRVEQALWVSDGVVYEIAFAGCKRLKPRTFVRGYSRVRKQPPRFRVGYNVVPITKGDTILRSCTVGLTGEASASNVCGGHVRLRSASATGAIASEVSE